MKLLDVKNISCEFDDPLFRDLSFSVAAGQAVHILGANGSGKTTLLRCLLGLYPYASGTIHWFGKTLEKASVEIAERVFYQAFELAFKQDLSPRENLQLWLRSAVNPLQVQKDAQQIDAAIRRALVAMQILEVADKPSRQLSSGQQRRLALSRLHLSPAQLWVLDEPFSAVDKKGVQLLESLINQHVLAGGSVLLTSHLELSLDVPVVKVEL